MEPDRTRRGVLHLAGGTLWLLSGCTTVIDGLSSAEREPTETESRATTTPQAADPTTRRETVETTSETETTQTETTAEPLDIKPPTLSFVDAPLPETPARYRYATMGSGDANATATMYGNWKCPYTRDFVLNQLDGIVDRYVRSGDLKLLFRVVAYRANEPFLGPDAPRAARVGVGTWQTDPESFWSYFATVFENQPPERRSWATADALMEFATTADVEDSDVIHRTARGTEYREEVLASAAAATDVGVFSVPRIVVDGVATAPTVDPDSTLEQLDRAVEM